MKHVATSVFFLSAEQLGLAPYQRDALVEVHQRMLSGHINETNFDYSSWPLRTYRVGYHADPVDPFYYRLAGGVDCGCLGYHADRVVGYPWADRCGQRLREHDDNHALPLLFYHGRVYLDRPPTLAESRAALETYLTTGVTEWQAL